MLLNVSAGRAHISILKSGCVFNLHAKIQHMHTMSINVSHLLCMLLFQTAEERLTNEAAFTRRSVGWKQNDNECV